MNLENIIYGLIFFSGYIVGYIHCIVFKYDYKEK